MHMSILSALTRSRIYINLCMSVAQHAVQGWMCIQFEPNTGRNWKYYIYGTSAQTNFQIPILVQCSIDSRGGY